MKRLIYHVHGVGRAALCCMRCRVLDIALWDILGKSRGLPIYQLLGGKPCAKLPAYASLLKYNDTDVVVRTCREALDRGYSELKIHETGRAEISGGGGASVTASTMAVR